MFQRQNPNRVRFEYEERLLDPSLQRLLLMLLQICFIDYVTVLNGQLSNITADEDVGPR